MTPNEKRATDTVDDLYDWSLNFTNLAPFRRFLDLIGYSEDALGGPLSDWATPSGDLGHAELELLGLALTSYANYPMAVVDRIEAIIEAERTADWSHTYAVYAD